MPSKLRHPAKEDDLITSVLAKNFKGRPSFEFKIGAKTLIVGPNGAGKSAIIQALQLSLDGSTPGVNKTNPAIMDAFGVGADNIYVEVGVGNGTGPTLLGRKFQRDRDAVKQILMVDRRKADQKAFQTAASQAPRIVAVDDVLSLSSKKLIDYLAELLGKNAEAAAISDRITETKAKISALQKNQAECESVIARTSENVSKLNLPPGSLAEIQKEIASLEQQLDEARGELAALKAKEEAEARAKAEAPRNGQTARVDTSVGEAFLRRMKGALSEAGIPTHSEADPADSIRAILEAIKEANCRHCKGGAALLIARAELMRWEGK
jgi:chromosome segregation ATPase